MNNQNRENYDLKVTKNGKIIDMSECDLTIVESIENEFIKGIFSSTINKPTTTNVDDNGITSHDIDIYKFEFTKK
jgi:hypothetical protein